MAKYEVTMDNEERSYVEVDGNATRVEDGVLEIMNDGARTAGFARGSWLFFKKVD